MKIYRYNYETKEYLDDSIADESPLEQGVYLIPAFSTDKKPPEVETNQVAVFENNEWIIKPDFRGRTFYDKTSRQAISINFIGDIPENLQETIPELSPEELAIENQQKINTEARNFLQNTDWQVLRHRDQLDLGIETSLTNEEFQNLLLQRQEARTIVI